VKINIKVILKTEALALMETASFCGSVCHKRYSGQQEIAPHYSINYKFQLIAIQKKVQL